MLIALAAAATPAAAGDKNITAADGTVKIKAAAHHLSDPVGLFRAGQTIALRASDPVGYAGCARGWYAVEPRGFVCATDATTFDPDHPRALAARSVLPADQGYPFQYARVTNPSPRLLRIPEAVPEDPLTTHFARTTGPTRDPQRAYPGMKVAWARELVFGDHAYVVTPDLHLIRKDHIENATAVLSRSAWLSGDALPFAITLRDTDAWPMTSLLPLASGPFRGGIDLAFKQGRRAARTTSDDWVTKADISVFGRRARPSGVAVDEQWIHVRINEGSLVAYVGDEAVFAAVISPGVHGANGKKKYHTPTGRFRISAKHLTSDMGGALSGGSWRSRAVPWVAYFHGGYALHGAWWHDGFGRPRSHGCINLTPGDARTLFRWLEPKVPEGWYAVRSSSDHVGTVVLVTP